MVEHEKKGWKHWHVVYSRIEPERMKTLPDGLDARVCHAAARRIENELGLQKVIGPFDREPGTPRPQRAPEPWEMYRGMKTKLDPREITAQVTDLFRQSETGQAFRAALESQGYRLATGRRGLLILDSAGNEHSLARRIDGIRAKELNAFMRDVDRQTLPTIEQAKEQFQKQKIAGLEADRATVRREIAWEEKLAQAAIEKEKVAKQFVEPGEGDRKKENQEGRERRAEAKRQATNEKHWPVNPPTPSERAGFDKAARDTTTDRRTENLKGYAKRVWEASLRSDSAKAFAASLDEQGVMFARVTKDEADRSQREAAFAREIGRYAPRFTENEIVIVTEPRHEYRRAGEIVEPGRIQKIDQSLAGKFVKHLGHGVTLHGIDATLKVSGERAVERRAARDAKRMDHATDIGDFSRELPGKAVSHTAAAARTVGRTLNAFAGALGAILPTLTPEQKRDGRIAVARREREAENAIDFQQYTADTAQRRRQQEDELEAARQRERERERGGRDR